MHHRAHDILDILDAQTADFSFPMLDNGYRYLAASRISLYRSDHDWSLVFEIFGYSPRTGVPDLYVITSASAVSKRSVRETYESEQQFNRYRREDPHKDFRCLAPITDGDWMVDEGVVEHATTLHVRGRPFTLPPLEDYAAIGIALSSPPRVQVYELSRYLAATARSDILAAPHEQRISVPMDLEKIFELDEWHHPDLLNNEKPSGNQTFIQLAEVLVTGDVGLYRPALPPNNHWSNWPEGGLL